MTRLLRSGRFSNACDCSSTPVVLPATIAAHHKVLLYQDWSIWRLTPQSAMLIEQPGPRYVLRRSDRYRIDLRPLEAAIVQGMSTRAGVPFHHVLALVATFPQFASVHVASVHVAIAATFERRREGFLEHADRPSGRGNAGAMSAS